MARTIVVYCIVMSMIAAFIPQSVFAAKDLDRDGLTDAEEKVLGTDPRRTDTDGDGYADRVEIMNGYSPLNAAPIRIKRIIISIKKQELSYYLGSKKLGAFKISTGKQATPTPYGVHKILNKDKRAWSSLAKLWMPWWMGFKAGGYGIHELPEWPGGKKEGANHLGKPVSHGCVRLGVGPAKKLYEWAEMGTIVIVQ